MRRSFLVILFSFIFVMPFSAQKKFDKKQIDSIYQKYTNLPELIKNKKQSIVEINAILPRISDDTLKVRLLTSKTILYGTGIKDQPEVLRSHLQAKKIIENFDGKREKVMIHLALAETYKNLKMYQLAMENLKIVDNYMSDEEMTPEKLSLIYMGHYIELDVLFNTKKYSECIKKADYILKTANKLTIQNHAAFAKMIANQYIGRSYLEMKDYPKAKEYLENSIALDHESLPDFRMRNNTSYAQLLYETNHPQEALKVLQDFPLGDNMDYTEESIARFSILSKVYAKIGNTKEFDLYVKKKDSLDRAYKEQEMVAVEEAQKYIEEEKDRTITSKNDIIYFLLIPLLLIAVGVVFYIRHRKSKEKLRYEQIINHLKQETYLKVNEDVNSEVVDERRVEDTEKQSSSTTTLSDDKEQELLKGLAKFEEKEKFRDVDLSLSSLASALKTNRTYLSEVIKKFKGKNYNTYINELRIHYIVRRLYNDPEYLNYKISYLAEDCGFVSHSSFATIFKAVLGISPSSFIQKLKEDQNS
ncbi:helix-turn-helix domain-containing protein [Soonwooa sp.]|uniref:helix-turn-helix domain-containing protein n=1 Tax=Soonwooa sp. TaxID=1938592 RepID=UPI00261DBF60|nr:helix-turn-helix domain-containing protein [Soonwooa sp.]